MKPNPIFIERLSATLNELGVQRSLPNDIGKNHVPLFVDTLREIRRSKSSSDVAIRAEAMLLAALAGAESAPVVPEIILPRLTVAGDRLTAIVGSVDASGRFDPEAYADRQILVRWAGEADLCLVGDGGTVATPLLDTAIDAGPTPFSFTLQDSRTDYEPASVLVTTTVMRASGGAPHCDAPVAVIEADIVRIVGLTARKVVVRDSDGKAIPVRILETGSSIETVALANHPLQDGVSIEADGRSIDCTVPRRSRDCSLVLPHGPVTESRVWVHNQELDISPEQALVHVDFRANVGRAGPAVAGDRLTAFACVRVGHQLHIRHVSERENFLVASLRGVASPDPDSGRFPDIEARFAGLNSRLAIALPGDSGIPIYFGSWKSKKGKKSNNPPAPTAPTGAGTAIAGWTESTLATRLTGLTAPAGNQAWSLTIFCDQPGSGGDRDPVDGGDVGHAFLELRAGTKVLTIGFYPENEYGEADALINNHVDGELVDDSGHGYEAKSKLYVLTQAQFDAAKNQIRQWVARDYYVRGSNCADFVHAVGTAAGQTIPEGKSGWDLLVGDVLLRNPGALGEDLVTDGGSRN